MISQVELTNKVAAAAKSGVYISVADLTAVQRGYGSDVTQHLLDRNIVRAALQPDLHPIIAAYLRQHRVPPVAVVAQLAAASTTQEIAPFFAEGGMGRVAELLPSAVQIYVASHDSPRLRHWVARQAADLSDEALALLARDDETHVRAAVALRGHLSDEQAERFVTDEPTVRVLLAQNPHLGHLVHARLIETLDARQLAGCRRVPPAAVDRLARESGLTDAVASADRWRDFVDGFNTCEDWQDYVGSFDSIDPLRFMIRNWALPPTLQTELVTRIAEAYRTHREEPAHHPAHRIAYELTLQPRLTPHELRTLLDAGLATGVAENESLPVELQQRIEAGSDNHILSDLEIRQAQVSLAKNSALDSSIRDRLLRSPNRAVASRAIHNLKLTSDNLAEIAYRIDDDVAIAAALAAHPALPLAVMDRLALHEHPQVRESLARNYSAPMELRDRLASDREEKVRYWAMSPRAVVKQLGDVHPPLARVAIDWT